METAIRTTKSHAPHTKTPWLAREGDTMNPARTWGIVRILSPEEHGCDPADGERTEVIAEVFDTATDGGEADAKRIAAAVNACEGVSIEKLEQLGQGSVAQALSWSHVMSESLKGTVAQARRSLNLLEYHSSLSYIDHEGEELGTPPHHVVIGGNAYWFEKNPANEYLVTAPVAAETGLVLFLENYEVEPSAPAYEAICTVLRATAQGASA